MHRLQLGWSPVPLPLAPRGEHQRARPVQHRREHACPGVYLGHLGHTPAPARDERLMERDQQVELSLPAPIAVGQAGNQGQPAAEQCHRFREHGAPPGLPAGGEPIVDRLFRQTRFLAVVGEQRRLGRDDLREPGFEGRGDAGMKLPAPVAQQGAIGGVLHQRVLEGVFGVRRGAAAIDQFGTRPAAPRRRPVAAAASALRRRSARARTAGRAPRRSAPPRAPAPGDRAEPKARPASVAGIASGVTGPAAV